MTKYKSMWDTSRRKKKLTKEEITIIELVEDFHSGKRRVGKNKEKLKPYQWYKGRKYHVFRNGTYTYNVYSPTDDFVYYTVVYDKNEKIYYIGQGSGSMIIIQ